MAIKHIANHFTRREQAIAEIQSDGMSLVEVDLSGDDLTPTPHVHSYPVAIYMLEGEFELTEPATGVIHVLKAGSKTVVPAETLHAEYCPGRFRAAIGLPADSGREQLPAG